MDLCDRHLFWVIDPSHNGIIRETCSKKEWQEKRRCTYVVKTVDETYDTRFDVLASRIGVAPKTIIMRCGDKTYLIQKRLSYTLTFLLKHPDLLPEDWVAKVSVLVSELLRHHVFHNDLHSDNILFDTKTKRFFLIDYETASDIRTMGYTQFDHRLRSNSSVLDTATGRHYPLHLTGVSGVRPIVRETEQEIRQRRKRQERARITLQEAQEQRKKRIQERIRRLKKI